MPRLRASIVVVGDEILSGFVQDTNSGWLAGRLRASGVRLDRVVTVPDVLEVIAGAVAGELRRERPRVVFTSGGIGSTPDDLTVAAVARCLGAGLVAQPEIDARISRALRWHEARGATVTPEHVRGLRKMALVPDGSYLVAPADEFAPGVAIDVDGGIDAGGAVVVVLPGVPAELKRIVVEGVEPRMLAGRGQPDHVVEIEHPYPESMLNPALEQVVREHPDVHVGSYPGGSCLIRLSGPEALVVPAAATVRAYLAELDATPGAADLQAAWRERWAAAGE